MKHFWRPGAVGVVALLMGSACSAQDSGSSAEIAPTTVRSQAPETRATPSASLVPSGSRLHITVPILGREGLPLLEVDQKGRAAVEAMIASSNGGRIMVANGPSGAVFQFPAYDDPSLGRRAVIRVVNAGTEDALAPGTSDFQFGAEFRLDALSAGDRTDDGDNLVQRGLFGDEAQYKIDIDKDTPSCRLKGTDGVIQVRASTPVAVDTWYAVRCGRRGDEVALTVLEYERSGWVERSADRSNGAIGAISWEASEVPFSVGGKLTRVGAVVERASDQFNGLVANPFLMIEE